MTAPSPGLHHITAICGEPAANRRFYTETLGLRLVKKTVNFDAPGTYHLYYGDQTGAPGTALTFFPFADVPQGQPGRGAPAELAFAVPVDALAYWAERLGNRGMATCHVERLGQAALETEDGDGSKFLLVATESAVNRSAGWPGGPVPAERMIRGFAGVSVCTAMLEPTARVLEQVLGFQRCGSEGDRVRFVANAAGSAPSYVDVRVDASRAAARQGVGSIHHVAFRAVDSAHQRALAERVAELGLAPTPPIDRQYFQSVYFREPGGALFEIATDEPGFTVDETAADLGQALQLPPQYEAQRARIEAQLPPLLKTGQPPGFNLQDQQCVIGPSLTGR